MPSRRRAPPSVGAALGEWQQLLQRRDAELAASEERFLAATSRSRDGLVIVDPQGTIRFVNPAAEWILGRPAGELLGQAFGCPVVADETVELDIRRDGGEPLIAEMRVAETLWEGQAALVCTLRDVTQRVRQFEALQRLAQLQTSVLDALPGRLVLVGADGVIAWASGGWTRRHGGGAGADYFRLAATDPAVRDAAAHEAAVRELLAGRQERLALGDVRAELVNGGPRRGALLLHLDPA